MESTDSIIEITEEQRAMLLMSEEDIKYGRTISQEESHKDDLEWLREPIA